MNPMLANMKLEQVRRRSCEGDCPVTPALSTEWLEDLVLHFALTAQLAARTQPPEIAEALRQIRAELPTTDPGPAWEPVSGPRYLIRKRGSYYRPNAQGYTTDVAKAGLFSKERAEQEARVEPDIIRAIPLTPDLLAALRSQPASRDADATAPAITDDELITAIRRAVRDYVPGYEPPDPARQPASRDSGEAMREVTDELVVAMQNALDDRLYMKGALATKLEGLYTKEDICAALTSAFAALPTSHSGSAS